MFVLAFKSTAGKLRGDADGQRVSVWRWSTRCPCHLRPNVVVAGLPNPEAPSAPADNAAVPSPKPVVPTAAADDKPARPAGGAGAGPAVAVNPVKLLIGDAASTSSPAPAPLLAPLPLQPALAMIVGGNPGDEGVSAPLPVADGTPEIFLVDPVDAGPGSSDSAPTFVNGDGPLASGFPAGIPAADTVPEPATWALLLLAGALLISRRGVRCRG